MKWCLMLKLFVLSLLDTPFIVAISWFPTSSMLKRHLFVDLCTRAGNFIMRLHSSRLSLNPPAFTPPICHTFNYATTPQLITSSCLLTHINSPHHHRYNNNNDRTVTFARFSSVPFPYPAIDTPRCLINKRNRPDGWPLASWYFDLT